VYEEGLIAKYIDVNCGSPIQYVSTNGAALVLNFYDGIEVSNVADALEQIWVPESDEDFQKIKLSAVRGLALAYEGEDAISYE
jgi:hypothetical protein